MFTSKPIATKAIKILATITTAAAIGACSSSDSTTVTSDQGPSKKTLSVPFSLYSGATELTTCDTTFAGTSGIGQNSQSGTVSKFAMFVHDIRVLDTQGNPISFTLDENNYQTQNVAMLTMSCGAPESANMKISGSYTSKETAGSISFKVGVPQAVNHQNPAEQPSPLNYGDLQWGWAMGKRFFVIEGTFNPVVNKQGFVFHVGSTGCNGDPTKEEAVTCSKSNRPDIQLGVMASSQPQVKIDIQALFDTWNFANGSNCHGFHGDFCKAGFKNLGLNFDSGAADASKQTVFSFVAK